MLTIKVPATSANIGPGYDSFGLALNLFNQYKFYRTDNRSLSIDIKDTKGKNIYLKDEDNLILNSVNLINNMYPDKINRTNLGIKVMLNYPLKRGLGSSSNAIIGTLVGLNYYFNLNLSNQKLLNIALQLEGHPDNIVPTLLGGFTISGIENKEVYFQKFNISDQLNLLLFIPDFEIKTSEARKVIEKKIPIEHTVKNIKNASLLTAGFLKNDIDLINMGKKDYIHQSKRIALNSKLNNFFLELENKLDIPFFLSGSGPTILFLNNKDFKEKLQMIKDTADNFKIVNHLIETTVNNHGIILNKGGD